MRALLLTLFATPFLLSCAPTDPIDRVVRQESLNHYFPSGMYKPIQMSPSASVEKLAAKALEGESLNTNAIGDIKVLAVRDVRISGIAYKGVLVDTSAGKKVILLRYDDAAGRSLTGWWNRVYN